VIVPEEEINLNVPRESIAYFVKPDNSTLLYPLVGSDDLTFANNDRSSEGVYAGEHFRKRTVYHHKYLIIPQLLRTTKIYFLASLVFIELVKL